MNKLKAKVGAVIDFPADALRSLVIDAGLSRAMRMRYDAPGDCRCEVSPAGLLDTDVPPNVDEPV